MEAYKADVHQDNQLDGDNESTFLTFKSLIITLISNVMPVGDFILAEG
jgi:hypothetical protein